MPKWRLKIADLNIVARNPYIHTKNFICSFVQTFLRCIRVCMVDRNGIQTVRRTRRTVLHIESNHRVIFFFCFCRDLFSLHGMLFFGLLATRLFWILHVLLLFTTTEEKKIVSVHFFFLIHLSPSNNLLLFSFQSSNEFPNKTIVKLNHLNRNGNQPHTDMFKFI